MGKEILKAERGEDLLMRLIYELRGEDLPGRFRDALVRSIHYYMTAREALGVGEITIPEYILTWGDYGDRFYYLKAAILSGLLNAFYKPEEEGDESG